MNVLLSAYACAPGKGSEPQIGWNWTREAAARHPVWILTRSKHQPAIDHALRARPLPNAHFVYVDLPLWARWWKTLPGGVYAYYLIWQFLAFLRARALHQRVHFQMVHHVTFCMFWMPSFLPLLRVPFVWGPLGGGESMPPAFRSDLAFRDRVFEFTRELVQHLAHVNPLVRFTAKKSVLALAGTPETAHQLERLGCREVRLVPVVGITGEDLAQFPSSTPRSRMILRICSAGRLLSWKGFHLALSAIARVSDRTPVEYYIFGDGPQRQRLASMARSLGISKNVHFCENVAREDLLSRLPGFDLLLHPSLHDSGGFICLEAMASGCAVICLEMGGPAMLVPPRCGLRLPASTSGQAVEGIAAAINHLYDDPALLLNLRAECRSYVASHLSFERYLKEVEIYGGKPVEAEAS
jgi:glycosyltransferase involved in cell wall biosynthesis